MNTCIQCVNWQLRDSPLRAEGFARCKVDPWEFAQARTFPADGQCKFNRFVQADEKIVQLRKARK